MKLSFKYLQYWINFFVKTKNTYRESFLCKRINQTAFWYTFLIFLLQLSFEGQIVWLLFLLVPGHLHRFSKQILIFSLVQLLMPTVFQIFLCKLWSKQSPNKNNPVDLHQVRIEAILRHKWKDVSILFWENLVPNEIDEMVLHLEQISNHHL